MNIQSLFPAIIIKGPHFLPRRTIQRTFKVPHQPCRSRLCLLLNCILLIHGHSLLRHSEFLVDALRGAEDIIQQAVEAFGNAVGVVHFNCFLESLVG